MITVTPKEFAVLEAAKAWAKAERALRVDAFDRQHRWSVVVYPLSDEAKRAMMLSEEARDRVVLECDHTEQKLLDAVEALP